MSLDNWEVQKTYTYFNNSNLTTIFLGDTETEYNLEIAATYNLDYIDYHRNNTNFEYGGLGNHALLHKVIIDDDEKGLLWHEWSQWAGSELDTAHFVTVDEALEELANHPEIDEIRRMVEP